jgi:hypothetical protein
MDADFDCRGRGHGSGIALALFAAGLLVASVFMPRLSSQTVDLGARSNRMIDGWEGWFLLLLGVGLLVAAVRGRRDGRWGVLVCLFAIAALGVAIYSCTGSRALLVQEVPGVQGAVFADPGLGFLVAALGAAIAFCGGLTIKASGSPDAAALPVRSSGAGGPAASSAD